MAQNVCVWIVLVKPNLKPQENPNKRPKQEHSILQIITIHMPFLFIKELNNYTIIQEYAAVCSSNNTDICWR